MFQSSAAESPSVPQALSVSITSGFPDTALRVLTEPSNDLYAFNFGSETIPLTQDRDPIETREAFRLIRLQLRVSGIEYDENARGEAQGKPIVHFEGRSKSTYMAWDPNANSRIRGESWNTVGRLFHCRDTATDGC